MPAKERLLKRWRDMYAGPDCAWRTRQLVTRVWDVPMHARRDTLLITDNPTEALFRTFDDIALGRTVNK